MNERKPTAEQQVVVDTFRQRAEQAIEQGQAEQARAWMEGVVALDDQNADAWLFLASLIPDARERMQCYARALQLSPGNAQAKAGLRKARRSM